MTTLRIVGESPVDKVRLYVSPDCPVPFECTYAEFFHMVDDLKTMIDELRDPKSAAITAMFDRNYGS